MNVHIMFPHKQTGLQREQFSLEYPDEKEDLILLHCLFSFHLLTNAHMLD